MAVIKQRNMTQAKDNKWLIFVAFTLLLFAKCLLFYWSVFHSILINSLLHII